MMNLKIDEPEKCELENIVLLEPVNLEILDKLINSDLLLKSFHCPKAEFYYENEREQLVNYRKLVKNGFAEIRYNKAKNIKYGRVCPLKALGLFTIRRQIRHTLAKEFFIDIDIENCHPILLSQICKKNDIDCKYLDKYIKNRDKILKKVQDQFNVSRDQAKKLFIQLLYFGSFNSWAKDNNVAGKEPSFINDFKNELQKIGNIIFDKNPQLVKIVEKRKKEQKITEYNKIGSVVSYYLQEYENMILEEIFIYCRNNKFVKNNICVLCADGLMILKELFKPELLTTFEDLILKKYGFKLTFTTKEMKEDYLNILDDHILTQNDIDKNILNGYDTNIFINNMEDFKVSVLEKYFLEDLENLEEDKYIKYFHLTKSFKYFNAYHAHFYIQNKIYKIHKHIVSSYADFNNSFAQLNFTYKNSYFKFTNLYDESLHKRKHSSFDFEPNRKIESDNYNLFHGFDFDDGNYIFDESLFKPYLDHIKFVCNDDMEVYNYILNWFAHIIQKPEKKTGVALVLYSFEEGLGKNIVLDVFSKLIEGYAHSIKDTNALTDKFNGDMMGKLFVVGDEIDARAQNISNELKDIITRDFEIIEFKGKDKIRVSDKKNYAFTTNNERNFKASTSDRRFMMNESAGEPKNRAYYNVLGDILENKIILKNLFNFLKTRDITNYSPSNIVVTNYKERLIMANLPAYFKCIIEDYDYFCKREFTTKELYDLSVDYAKNNRLPFSYTETFFCVQFKKAFGEFNYLHPKTRTSLYKFDKDKKNQIEDIIKNKFLAKK